MKRAFYGGALTAIMCSLRPQPAWAVNTGSASATLAPAGSHTKTIETFEALKRGSIAALAQKDLAEPGSAAMCPSDFNDVHKLLLSQVTEADGGALSAKVTGAAVP